MNFKRRAAAVVTRSWTSSATLLLLFAVLSKANEAELFNAGPLRAVSSASGDTATIPVVNLGHCCALCTASSTCTIVNYLASSRVCELLSATANGAITWSADSSSQMFIKVDIIGDVIPTTAQMQQVTGVQMRAEGYTSYSIVKVINVMQCWRLCSAVTGGLCRLFAYHATHLSCVIYDVDFYSTWTTSSIDPGWTSYYASQTSGWKLLYKISKAIGVYPANVFLTGTTTTAATSAQMAMDATCGCYLRSDIVDNWSHFPISAVSLILATGGKQMKYLNFTTTADDTASTFFTASKISASSWKDLNSSVTPAAMEIGTPTSNKAGRYFLIEKNAYVNCTMDNGWLSVNGLATTGCSYDVNPAPQFAYSNGSTSTYFTSSVFADALLIYGKL